MDAKTKEAVVEKLEETIVYATSKVAECIASAPGPMGGGGPAEAKNWSEIVAHCTVALTSMKSVDAADIMQEMARRMEQEIQDLNKERSG